MVRRTWLSALLLTVMSGYGVAQDAHSVLQEASESMGMQEMISIQYSGTGWVGMVGQNYDPAMDWPRLELKRYSRTIDFDSMSSSEDLIIVQGDYPTKGGGGIPIRGERRRRLMVSGEHAWNMQGEDVVSVPGEAELRSLRIYLTPYGFIKGAMAADPTVVSRYEYGQRVRIVSFIALDKYRINATIGEEGRVLRIQTWLPSPVVGDMYYETVFSNYREIDGIQFPGRWHQHHDFDDGAHKPNVSGGDHAFHLEDITSVSVNVRGAKLDVPSVARNAEKPQVNIETTRIGDGLWLIGGGSHNSVTVEFEDYIAVVETPLNEDRSLAVIEEIYRLVPDKPIRYIVTTHHHWDHIGGMRTYMHEGATVITHDNNHPYYQEVLRAGPWLLEPDRYSLYPPEEWSEGYIFETVSQKYILGDSSRMMEMHYVGSYYMKHAEGMLVAYLPEERILIEADIYSPGREPGPDAGILLESIRRLNLDVQTIVPIHGQPVPMDRFLDDLGEAR